MRPVGIKKASEASGCDWVFKGGMGVLRMILNKVRLQKIMSKFNKVFLRYSYTGLFIRIKELTMT